MDLLVELEEVHKGLLVRLQEEQGLPVVPHARCPSTSVDKGTVASNKLTISTWKVT